MSASTNPCTKRFKTSIASLPAQASTTSSLNLANLDDSVPLHSDLLWSCSDENERMWLEIDELRQKIAHYKNKIQSWESRIQQLRKEHQRVTRGTLLMKHPEQWSSLPLESRYEKESIIAVLQAFSNLPDELYGYPHAMTDDMKEVFDDKEVYLACLDRHDFEIFFSNYGVPVTIRYDKEVQLMLVQRYPAYLASPLVPDNLFDDPDILCSFLKRGATFLGWDLSGLQLNRILTRFSSLIWASESLLLKVILLLCKITSPTINNDLTFLTCSESPLLSDKAVWLRIAFAIQQVAKEDPDRCRSQCPVRLQHLCKTLRSDAEVVTAFCRVNGNNLDYASPQLRGCPQVVALACQEHPCAILSALPCQTRTDLLSSKQFVLNLIQQHRTDWRRVKSKLGNYPVDKLFDILPLKIRQNRDIAVAASVESRAILRRIKDAWFHDREFWLRVLQECRHFSHVWDHLPCAIKRDSATALFVLRQATLRDESLVIRLVKRFPRLMLERDAIRYVVSTLDESIWPDLLRLVPLHTFDDKNFCLELLRLNGRFYSQIPMHLRANRDVVEAALWRESTDERCTEMAVPLIPKDIQILFPDLVAGAVRYNDDPDWDDDIADELLLNRGVVLARVLSGFSTEMEAIISDRFSDDREILLAVAKHGSGSFQECCSETLLGNKQFMLEVVDINGTLIRFADKAIMFDFELMLTAFANRNHLAYDLSNADVQGEDRIASFGRQVRQRLRDFLAFTTLLKGISCNTSFSPSSSSSSSYSDRFLSPTSTPSYNSLKRPFVERQCHLPLLNQGTETSMAYKRLIAEYCGIPMREELQKMKRVMVDLTRWGF